MKTTHVAFPSVVLVVLAAGVAYKNGTFSERPKTPALGGKGWAKRLENLKGLENVGEVAPGIYRGAQPEKEGYATLKEKLGVKTVINLRNWTSEKADVIAAGLEAVEIPLQADVRGSQPPSDADIEKFLNLVRDPSKQPIYFHCAHGKDRTGTMCAVYRMEVLGWSPEDAYQEMDSFGFNHIWTDLAAFVNSYKPRGRWRAASANVAAVPSTAGQ